MAITVTEKSKKTQDEETLIAWEKAVAVSDDELIERSVRRLGEATERLTRRNMKLCVTEYIQTLCYEDMEFVRLVMHPKKNMGNCFRYINRKALEYLQSEAKANGEKEDREMVAGDVPDELCYTWAESYYRDLNAPEDEDKPQRPITRPSTGKTAQEARKKDGESAPTPTPVAEKEPEKKPKDPAQMTMDNLFDAVLQAS